MAEYEFIVTCTQVYRVYVEADDEDAAQVLAETGDGEVELLRDTIEAKLEGVYD